MEVDGKDNENSSPPLDFEEFPQYETSIENEIQIFPDMKNELQKLFTELQMFRSGVCDTKQYENEINKYKEKIMELEQILENIQREGQCAAEAAEKMVIERDNAMKRLAVIEPSYEAMEQEKLVLEEKFKEMFYALEAMKRDENNAQAQLKAHDIARTNVESELNRLKKIIEDLQTNQSRLEEELEMMTKEMEASKRLQLIWNTMDEQRQQKYETIMKKFKDALEKQAIISGQLGELQGKTATNESIIRNDFHEIQEDELMQLVNED